MDVRPDTSSGRSHDSWSFLNQGSAHDPKPRSQPPSSYLRSDRSSVSPLPNSHFARNGSRSSFSRNLASASTGARSTATIPSQPVLSRIHSQNAYDHNNQFPKMSRRPLKLDRESGLPAREEFSIQGILDAIHEDIEGDLNTIAEILGRSRFVLADQHEAQMPPQGEIMLSPGPEAETAPIDDSVMILNEDASLIDGSNSGSAAYGLLERLQAVPRPVRMSSDAAALISTRPQIVSPIRTHSSPAAIQPEPENAPAPAVLASHQPPNKGGMASASGPSRAVISEMYLSAEADGVNSGVVPTVSEAGRHYPLYTYDDSNLFEAPVIPRRRPLPSRRFGTWATLDFSALTSWYSTGLRVEDQDAEARLRGLLNR